MKKHDLLNIFDDELLNKLFGYCYARTNDSYEAEEVCSDIVYALMKTAQTDGEIQNVNSFIWRVARNVYADYSEKRRRQAEQCWEGDPEEIILNVPQTETSDDTEELLSSVYHHIAYLTKAYREVMISFYLNGSSVAQIAAEQGVGEGTVRQRLFAARRKIKSEVEEMMETYEKPVALDKIDIEFWGQGNPGWGDPSEVCTRQFSTHIIWLCRNKPMRASEIAAELNVPTVYVEEELEILCNGMNGTYGLLHRVDGGRYAINFVLLDKETMEQAAAIYAEQLPKVCDVIANWFEAHKEEYLAFPYLNKRVDINLVLWQQLLPTVYTVKNRVASILADKYFANAPKVTQPFSVYGYVDSGKCYGSGWDGIDAENICGYARAHFENIYITCIQHHFLCGHNVSTDPQLQLAVRAIGGLGIAELNEREKEHAAKAVECGYLYREGDRLYTKILVSPWSKHKSLFQIAESLEGDCFEQVAADIADQIARLIKKSIPEHLLGEWEFANGLAALPLVDGVAEYLIEKGILTPPENGIGGEGCWMSVEK